jgi:hypothetical protein
MKPVLIAAALLASALLAAALLNAAADAKSPAKIAGSGRDRSARMLGEGSGDSRYRYRAQ